MLDSNAFQSDWISPPGDTIVDILSRNSMSNAELATALDASMDYVDALLRGHVEIDRILASRLHAYIGGSPEFWLRRDSQYRQDLVRLR